MRPSRSRPPCPRAIPFRLLPAALLLLVASVVAPVLASAASAATLEVGPGRMLAVPSAAAAVARPGDRVLIAPGRYRDCAIWRTPDITIEAAPGGEVVVFGPVCADKALFVVAAPRITIAGITFTGARATPGNGAGIRAEGGDLVIRRSRFLDNQNGILAAALPDSSLHVEDSVFISNGARIGDCAHGLYAGALALLRISASHFEATRACHHVKSRARRTEIIETTILDGEDSRSSYLVDIPDGGDLLLARSTLRKGPASAQRAVAVAIGAEGARQPTTMLRIEGNDFANLQRDSTVFVWNRTRTPAELVGNRLHGRVVPLRGPGTVR